MIVKRQWFSHRGLENILFKPQYFYTGYFLFGFIPIWIERKENK